MSLTFGKELGYPSSVLFAVWRMFSCICYLWVQPSPANFLIASNVFVLHILDQECCHLFGSFLGLSRSAPFAIQIYQILISIKQEIITELLIYSQLSVQKKRQLFLDKLNFQPAIKFSRFWYTFNIFAVTLLTISVIYNYLKIQMSSQKSIQKKPFLKKGTRQFLSNAQVRSQSSKPKVVDFGADEQQQISTPNIKVRSSQNIDTSNNDIKIKVKPSSSKAVPPSKNQQHFAKRADRVMNERPQDLSANKPKRQTSIGKKKQAVLADYLDNESGLNDDYQIKRTSNLKNENFPNNTKYEQKKTPTIPQKKQPNITSLKNANLVQQDDCDEEEETANFYENDSFKPISNPFKNKQLAAQSNLGAVKQQSAKQITPRASKKVQGHKNYNEWEDEKQDKEEVNFISDKSDEQQDNQRYMINKKVQNKKQQVRQQNSQGQQTISKIKMNYFNKNPQNSIEKNKSNKTIEQQKQVSSKKILTPNDVPKQIKQLIIKQAIAQKQQQLHQELQKLKQKFAVVSREKQKIQEQQKALAKARQQFQKQIEQKNKQFEEKLKNQNSKLARQKKYMKDAQMSGQVDRKLKAQLQETKKLLQKQKQQRKKIESKLKVENENLRKKLTEQANSNKLLCQKVKLLQHGSVINKQQLQQMIKQQKRSQTQTQKVNMWAQAPQSTFLTRFSEQEFSLIQIDPKCYRYEQNEYYQYYMKIKDIQSPLESETADSDRAKRVYKNGKIENQYFQRYLKQTFPFKYSIVYMYNGDIKQVLPEGIIIYYAQNSGAIHYTVKKEGGVHKEIIYFPSCDTVQMEVKYNEAKKNYNEVYCNGHLKRVYADGTVILQKKEANGKIITMPIHA